MLSNGWTGYWVFRTACVNFRTSYPNVWTACQNFRTGYPNDWTACQNFRTGYPNNWTACQNHRADHANDWTACQNFQTGWHRRMNGFMINFERLMKNARHKGRTGRLSLRTNAHIRSDSGFVETSRFSVRFPWKVTLGSVPHLNPPSYYIFWIEWLTAILILSRASSRTLHIFIIKVRI